MLSFTRYSFSFVLAVLAAHAAPADAAPDPAGIEFFEKKIRPVLVQHCYECHSGESDEVQGGLLLDTRQGLLKGGETGPGLVPADPSASRLIEAVRYKDEQLQMPPEGKLSDEQIADLEAWVKMGAPDPREADAVVAQPTTAPTEAAKLEEGRKHWAFQKPKEHPLPTVKDTAWAKQPIDRFILAKLEEKGLAPSPQADPRTLIRRVYFDLLGLPPPPDEVEAFVKDHSPASYAALIDRLLASPLYGQRWARHWLDVVRYTDSFDARVLGNEQDVAFAWRYRDWVVDSFNRDLPYDQFIMQQVAGDLLPAPAGQRLNKDGVVATGVYVFGEWGGGDSDKDKLITDIVDDQVDLTSRAFMGMTISCARCHDHKFDPISTKDYYGMAGIFFSSHILPEPGPKTAGPNVLRVPLLDEVELAQRESDKTRAAQLEDEIDKALDAQFAALAAEMLPKADAYLAAAWEYEHAPAGSQRPSLAQFAQERGVREHVLRQWVAHINGPPLKLLNKPTRNVNDEVGVHSWRLADGAEAPLVLVNTTAAPVETIPSLTVPPKSVSLHPSPSAGVAVAWTSPITGRVKINGNVIDGHDVCGDGIAWSLSRAGGESVGEIASGTIANAGRQSLSDGTGGASLAALDVTAGEMLQLAILPKVEYSCDTTQVELSITEVGGSERTWDLAKDALASSANPFPDAHGNASVWQFHDLAGQADAAFAAGSPIARFRSVAATASSSEPVRAAAADVARALREVEVELQRMRAAGEDPAALATPDAAFHKALLDPRGPFWAPARGDDANLPDAAREQLAAQRAELNSLRDSIAQPIPQAVALQEGGTPKSMFNGVQDVPVHIRGRYDRLGELVPRRFPLVVAGDSQPPITEGSGRIDLAKWLASSEHPLTARVMVNRIWQHHFGEGIVRTPNNYGKLGAPPSHPELLDHLALEFVRSGWSIKAMHRAMMLSATYMQSSVVSPEAYKQDPENHLLGRLNRRKLEAEALRDALLAAAGALDTAAGGVAVRDMNTPRRTLYVMTIRSDRSSYRALFDAADPAAIVEKRIDSTVAPQALFLMNHPFVLERAKQLAQRIQREAGDDDTARIDWLYRTLFARPAQPKEAEIARQLISGSDAPEAAWQAYCHVLLCANEFMYVD